MAKKRRSSQFKDTSQVIDIEEARKRRQEKREKQQKRMRQQTETPAEKKARARVKAGRRRKIMIYAVIIICIIAAVSTSIIQIVKLKAEYKEAEQINRQLQQQKEDLEQQVKDSDEKKFIEEEAREQLRMVKPGETVYIVPNLEENSGTTEKESE